MKVLRPFPPQQGLPHRLPHAYANLTKAQILFQIPLPHFSPRKIPPADLNLREKNKDNTSSGKRFPSGPLQPRRGREAGPLKKALYLLMASNAAVLCVSVYEMLLK